MLVSMPPASGANVILVTPKPNILDTRGKDWFVVREGEASNLQVRRQGRLHADRPRPSGGLAQSHPNRPLTRSDVASPYSAASLAGEGFRCCTLGSTSLASSSSE